jgi:hypothetical protein
VLEVDLDEEMTMGHVAVLDMDLSYGSCVWNVLLGPGGKNSASIIASYRLG